MLAELVLALRQRRVPCRTVVQAFVDLRLQMLGAEADREGLAGKRQAQLMQHGKGIPGAVPHGKDKLLTGNAACRGVNAGQGTVSDLQAGQRRIEPHLPAQRLYLPADAADHIPQKVGADMRLLPPGNICRRAMVEESPRHKGAQRVTDTGGQLSVREGPRAALAKLDIGIRIQLAGLFKMADRADTLIKGGAALQHQRAVAAAGQQQRSKEACRAKAHDHRAVCQRHLAPGKVKGRRLCETDTGRGPGQRRFLTLVLECDCDGVDKHRRAAPGVHAKLCHTAVRRLAGGHAENGQSLGRRLGVRVGAGQRQADIAD